MPSLRQKIRFAALALLAALAVALPASAQTFPRLSGRVVDDATVLDTAMRDGIAQRLKALEDQTSDQVVVATVRSLQGYTIEDYANRLFRAWSLGRKDKNNGVLLLIAPTEHKVRIEVGYGLEGTLTDAVSKLIIENHLIPWLRQSRYDVAASTGVDDIVEVLTGHAAEWQQRARTQARATNSHVHDLGVIRPGSFLSILLFVVFGGAFLVFFGVIGFAILTMILRLLVFIHLLPHAKDRQGGWLWLNRFDPPVDPRSLRRSHRSSSSSSGFWSSSSSDSSSGSWSSSSSSDSFSGGGGSSGGGGASGSW